MWKSMEEVLRGLKEEGIIEDMKNESGLPPGFRFHPTDEELITYYLASKVFNTTTTNNSFCSTNNNNDINNATSLFLSNYFSGIQIAEVDLTRCEPWDLPERAKMGEKEWYLFSLRDRKYPSGLRTNRATETGYWKATGKDRQVYASSIATTVGGGGGVLIGMKKTLVFYQGRAPRGVKTKWVMHEYRLDGHFSAFRHSSKEEWVICRIFYKNNGEKKSSPIIHHPPFLSTLPPLQELTSTTTATTTQVVADSSLLHSLLSNPLPNFSSITGSADPIFPSTTTSLATPSVNISSTLFNPLPRPTANAAVTVTAAAAAKQQQQQQNWLDRICPQVQTQYFQNQNQYHNHDHIFDQTTDNYPFLNNYSTATASAAAATAADNNDEKDNNIEVSPSFGVPAVDRMLLLSPAESWSFHYP